MHIIIDGYNLIRQSKTLSAVELEDIQRGREALIERINAAFGYRAVEDIRIIQAPLHSRAITAPRRSRNATPAAASCPRFDAIAEPRLQAAFERMASGIAAKSKKTAMTPAF